ncbi:MAG: hypothetical protein J0I77_18725 [Rudaea sp.]|uniref:alpha/beta hydrolase n=1 Tax=unclassified Rudaea TaxID=2627037 RepID=UPI0010F7371C|nr:MULTISPECIES: alpha/beta hydrolase-fold protein [unclassified Rudaea]MBN8887768.1 hypothetical protein [Rudaea sp.]
MTASAFAKACGNLLIAALLSCCTTTTALRAAPARPGSIAPASAYSPALKGKIDYQIYLPPGYANSSARYPSLYLLHGRGDSMTAWTRVKSDLDALIAAGKIPPIIVVMPDAPWSGRGNWYVDSAYTGSDYPGQPVETALTRDLVKDVDANYRTVDGRWARAIGGYSMGGAGALRYVFAHTDLFSAALVLSPAVYHPLPPKDSSTRDYGAFGIGDKRFDDARYQQLSYAALLGQVDPDVPVHLYLAVGDKEYVNPEPEDASHDLDFETAVVYNKLVRVPGVSADWRVLGGGHDWDVWQPGFNEGVQNLFRYVGAAQPQVMDTPLIGTAGDDWAGGVVPDGAGGVIVALAAAGSIDGATYAGSTDAVVTRCAANGQTLWTTEFGTSAAERLYGAIRNPDGSVTVAGYTNGNLDGAHAASNSAGDAFAAAVGIDGKLLWKRQYGDPKAADRAYAIAPDGAGGSYLAGYTKGSIDGVTANAGDKDAFLMRIDRNGNLLWSRQFGGPGEDKALAVTASANAVYVAGVTSAAMPGGSSAGGTDGWVAAFTPDGTRNWLQQVGTAGDDLISGAAINPNGILLVTGTFGQGENGGKDAVVIAYSPDGRQRWQRQIGTADDDAGVAIAAPSEDNITIVGHTKGRLAAQVGDRDLFAAVLDGRGKVQSLRQFGTVYADGADTYSESNLFMALDGATVWTSGVTYGNTTATRNHGGADVFVYPLR